MSYEKRCIEDAERLLRPDDGARVEIASGTLREIISIANDNLDRDDAEDFYDYGGEDEDAAGAMLGALKRAVADGKITDVATLNAWIAEREEGE